MEMDYWRIATKTSRFERKTNIEIGDQSKVKTGIWTKIDERRLRLFGHVKRIVDNKLPKIMLNWKPTGKSRRGMAKKSSRGNNLTKNLNRYGLRQTDSENREACQKRFKDTFLWEKPQYNGETATEK